MAVVCIPGTTIALDVAHNEFIRQPLYISSGVTVAWNMDSSATAAANSLYWDSDSGEPAVWDTEQTAVWEDANEEETTFESGAQVVFGEGNALNKSVEIAPEGVHVSAVKITGTDYQFSGGDMVVTDSVSAEQSAMIDSVLVIGSYDAPLKIQVAEGEYLTASVLETSFAGSHEHHIYENGSFVKNGEGMLHITKAVHGSITGATVAEGVLSLGSGVSLDVGANEIKGGTLQNVELLVTGEIDRAVSGNVAMAHNIIKTADGKNAAVLTDVTLFAGTTTEYATLQNVSFAGESTLRGYITFEKTQRQGDISVAAGGTLTVENVCFDLHGLASGDKVLIDSSAGTLSGWDTAQFVYSGITVNSAAVDSSVAGVVTIKREHEGNLYWSGAADDKWNAGSENWSTQPNGTGGAAFTALSNVHFGAAAANRDITVAQDLVAMELYIENGGYSFSGGRIATLGNAVIDTGADTVTFRNQLVVQENLITSGTGTLQLHGATTVVKDMTLGSDHIVIDGDVTVLGNFIVNSGSLDINGNVTAGGMNIAVSSGDNANNNPLVNVKGNLSVGESGNMIIGGTAEQHYLGVLTAGDLTVNTQKNHVYFDHLHVRSLTVDSGAYVHVQTSSAASSLSTSTLPDIYLSGTLALDAKGATYDRGYTVHVQDAAASLVFGSGCTIDNLNLIGQLDNSGYTNVDIKVQSRSATVTEMKDLGKLKVELGSLTVKNAEKAIHGELILDNGKLKLGAGADNIMADGSGALRLQNGSRLDIGMTSQTLSADNKVYLSGASSITGDANGTGLQLVAGAFVDYKHAGNNIAAKMILAQGITLNSSLAGSSLDISGSIAGSGIIKLTGAGTVALSGANKAFDGQVSVQENSVLTLQNTEALLNAGVTLNAGATLELDAPGAVNINTLTLFGGSSLAISSIVGTDDASAKYAVLNANKGVTFGEEKVELNLIFSGELDTLRTYNLLTGVTSIANLSVNVQHNGAVLDASQYKICLDAETNLLYIQTLMGNVWASADGGVWSTGDTHGNWIGGSDANNNYVDNKAAIFGDLEGVNGACRIEVDGTVTPGNVYFVADNTEYVFIDSAETSKGQLADGTNIHKDGAGVVTLGLNGNQTADAALGDVDIQAGSFILQEALAVKGTVSIEKDALLVVNGDTKGMKMVDVDDISYTASSIAPNASATLSGVTMDADGIRGADGAFGSAEKLLVHGDAQLSNLTLTDFVAEGNVTLSNVTLASSGELVGVTIAKKVVPSDTGVVVDASGSYSLSGNITFEDTLINNGTVTVADGTHVEIGKIKYESAIDASGKAVYQYQLISSAENAVLNASTFTADQVSINGVNLANDLANGIGTVFVDKGDGSFSISVGQILASTTDEAGKTIITEVDGTVGMPQWDERWGKTENAPGLSRRYTGEENLVISENAEYYQYGSIVDSSTDTADDFSVTLSSVATGHRVVGGTGDLVVGGYVDENGTVIAPDQEMWIYDCSGFDEVIAGVANDVATTDAVKAHRQVADTHILVNSDIAIDNPDLDPNVHQEYQKSKIWEKHFVIGGSLWANQGIFTLYPDWGTAKDLIQAAESYVTVQNGQIYNVFGASCGGQYDIDDPDNWGVVQNVTVTQYGTSHVFVEGGRIGEIFAGGYFANLIGSQEVNGRTRAVEMVLTGGTIGGTQLRVFGGTDHATVLGDIYVRMEGDAKILSQLVGGSNAGRVYGNIELDLISGSAFRVDAAGLGWKDEWGYEEKAYIEGEVLVNLYSTFELGSVDAIDPAAILPGGIYGGRELTNNVNEDCTSILHFADGKEYKLASIGENGYDTSTDSIIVTGFDRFELEEDAHVVLGLGVFDIDMGDASNALVISGKGEVEVIGHGIEYDVKNEYGSVVATIAGRNLGRDIILENGATLKISTSVIGLTDSADDRLITVENGSTIDFSGFSLNTGYEGDTEYAGLGFDLKICGNGVDNKGAIYKGSSDNSLYPNGSTNTNRIVLPNVTLTGSASVNVEVDEMLFMNACEVVEEEQGAYVAKQGTAHLDLAGHTLTKLGAGDFIARSVEMTPGTILVQQGAFGFDLTDNAAKTDMVLSADSELKLNATNLEAAGTTGLVLRSLSGAGAVTLNGSTLTLHTVKDNGYYDEYMDEAQSHDQFSGKTGFGYAVFSGLISDGSDSGNLIKNGSGVHYISGSSNTYTGGTLLQEGRLYLLGTGEASKFTKGESKVASGVAGTGAIVWSSAEAELYLGHGVRIYNEGTTGAQCGVITIGVEGAAAAPNGLRMLADFVGIHSKGADGTLSYITMGGKKYVEIETHNLKSIDVNALYADGTAYVANTDIDRNKMLLVKESDWNEAQYKTVTGFSDTGYNEAVYSGVLHDSNGVSAKLHKVGVGTLVLDQSNSYSGGTEIEAGTLRVRGWGSLGKNVKENAVMVHEGATLMFTHNSGYGEEPTSAANDITINGSGGARWTDHAATDYATAALISAVGPAVTFTLSGDISGSGNVRHSGEGVLVLSGDSSYEGGTYVSRGTLEVQSATGLGATASGLGAVIVEDDADLRITVESDFSGERMVTTLAADENAIQGDVLIRGKAETERILHMDGMGYDALSTSLEENATLLINGAAIDGVAVTAESELLTGSGRVVVSDATASGASAVFESMYDYTGDFRVEGDKASISVKSGTFIDGSIYVAGQQASVSIGSDVFIADGESLLLTSTGDATLDTAAMVKTDGILSIEAGAILSVQNLATFYEYNLSDLENAAGFAMEECALMETPSDSLHSIIYHQIGSVADTYDGQFDASIAVNYQAVGAVQTNGGLTLAGGATYQTVNAHTCLMGGSLTLDTMENSLITFHTTPDLQYDEETGEMTVQLVLFSEVSSVYFGYDQLNALDDSGVYYALAERYLTGSDFIDDRTLLVFDSYANVVYLQLVIPEPSTATLSLLALAALAARRRRK